MDHRKFRLFPIVILATALLMAAGSSGKPSDSTRKIPDLIYLGSTSEKELYITEAYRKATFYYSLGFGCPYMFDRDANLTLASVETREEVELVDNYFAIVEKTNGSDPVWTSGFSRLGKIPDYWASTGREVGTYPSLAQGDWAPGEGSSPGVADWNCVAITRYCDQQGHGATIPRCDPAPYGTWFTVRPCHQSWRFLCEKRL